MSIQVRPLSRAEAEAAFDDLARLRIEVFRDFPYLYDGDLDYERRYLATYLEGEGATIVGAHDGDRLIGAATASPLANHFEEFGRPFAERGLDISSIFYFGESVLEKPYRGRGIGVRFFTEREAAAIAGGFGQAAFCAVIRAPDHPMRPANYVPLDDFWRRRGYRPVEGMVASFSWRDIGDGAETAKRMQFWMKELPASP